MKQIRKLTTIFFPSHYFFSSVSFSPSLFFLFTVCLCCFCSLRIRCPCFSGSFLYSDSSPLPHILISNTDSILWVSVANGHYPETWGEFEARQKELSFLPTVCITGIIIFRNEIVLVTLQYLHDNLPFFFFFRQYQINASQRDLVSVGTV